jgi:hypothetical protein
LITWGDSIVTQNRVWLAAVLGAAVVLFSPTAKAGVYNFDANTGGFIEAFGTFTTDAPNGVTGNIISVVGTVIGGPDPGPISFVPGPGNDGIFFWDNILSPASNPQLSNAGVLFYTTTYEYNAFSNGPDNYSFWAAPRAGGDFITADEVRGFITAIPELSTWAMMLLGFAGIGIFTYRRAKRITSIVA